MYGIDLDPPTLGVSWLDYLCLIYLSLWIHCHRTDLVRSLDPTLVPTSIVSLLTVRQVRYVDP